MDKSKKTRNRQGCNKGNIIEKSETHSTNSGTDSQTNTDLACSVGRNAETSQTIHTASIINDLKTSNLPHGTDNYMNSAYLQSLEFYENSKELRDRSLIKENLISSVENQPQSSTTSQAPMMVHSVCKKCKHEPKLPFPNPQNKQDDYLMMEPSSSDGHHKPLDMKTVCQLSSCTKQVPGYLPMHPVGGLVSTNTQDFLKMRLCQQLMGINDRAASSPSLTDHNLEMFRKESEIETNKTSDSPMSLSHSISAANSPYLRRRVLSCVNELAEREPNQPMSRKTYFPNSNPNLEEFAISLDGSEKLCCSEHDPNVNRTKTNSSDSTKQPTVHSKQIKKHTNVSCDVLESHDKLRSEDTGQYENIDWGKLNLNEPIVHIRSSSVPSKSSHNRDSSSSNDSGVSSCSMKKQTYLSKNEMPVGSLLSSRRYTYTRDDQNSRLECFHSSLPRRSKSVDPLQDIAFQFQKVEIPMKSSSAEAEVPVCHSKQEAKGI